MGYLWANMEKIDVQGTYEALTQTQEELSDAKAENANLKTENTYLKSLLAAHGIEIPET